jgi:murein DD-endopeptidase MepM/ murein hydrolase activator NlpD
MNTMKCLRDILLPSAAALLLAACSSSPTAVEPGGAAATRPAPGDETLPPEAAEAPNRVPDEAMPAAEGAFQWPVRGTVLERLGTGGLRIRASGDVAAAKSGVVRLILSSWSGRRNLIIIRHADGYLTEYSDVDEILVPRGKAVRQGEPVARLKGAGVMHFRLYREKQALDPGLFLP